MTISLIAPTVLVDDRLEKSVAGVRMVLSSAPSEAIDEIVTRFPDLGVAQPAELVWGKSFPNLHSIRGSEFRDPQRWFRSIDAQPRTLPADFMVPSHGRLVAGRQEVADRLRDYRDAISYAYDQTIRHTNRGALPDDLARLVTIPPHLVGNRGWASSMDRCRIRSVRSSTGCSAGSAPIRRSCRSTRRTRPLAISR